MAYQRAIEEIYWRQRIWPAENSKPKPTLDEVMPLPLIQHKVEAYLRQSQALADYWQSPVRSEQLQAEITRMSRDSKQPDTLREIYHALNNDPLVIAECLARPALVERLIKDAYSSDERFHREVKQRAEADLRSYSTIEALKRAGRNYSEKEVSTKRKGDKGNRVSRTDPDPARLVGARLELREDAQSYFAASISLIDDGRWQLRRIAWNKEPFDSWWSRIENQIAMADPTKGYDYSLPAIASRSARLPNEAQATLSSSPSARSAHTAVWTGSEMIIWGGHGDDGKNQNTGARYNPATDTWTATNMDGAPEARGAHVTVWSGSEMIVWGGVGNDRVALNSGGRYNPSTDVWIATNTNGAANPGGSLTSVWTGAEMIVWGGSEIGVTQNSGGRYNPGTDSWTPVNAAGSPDGRNFHTAVWTGSEMIVWGGLGKAASFEFLNTGGRYNPATNSWTATATTAAAAPRYLHSAVGPAMK